MGEGVQDREAKQPPILEELGMNPDLDTLATALYVTIDDLLVAHREWAPPRPAWASRRNCLMRSW